MADRREIVAVYGAGLVQGVSLVAFPAASSILTSPDYYGLSSTAYGALFLPQAVAAIGAALAGSRLTPSYGVKRVLLIGLIGDLVAMSLLFASQAACSSRPTRSDTASPPSGSARSRKPSVSTSRRCTR
jgi:MFS family permease